MGNITGAMVFQSTIPTVVALVFASEPGSPAPAVYVAFASAGDRLPVVGGHLHPDGPLRPPPSAGACWSAALFYVAYLAAAIASVIAASSDRQEGRPGPADILGATFRRSAAVRRTPQERPHADREVTTDRAADPVRSRATPPPVPLGRA